MTLCNEGQDSYFCVVLVEGSPCPSFKFRFSECGHKIISNRCVLNYFMLSSNTPVEEFVLS